MPPGRSTRTVRGTGATPAPLRQLLGLRGSSIGSSAWVVGGRHTESGLPIEVYCFTTTTNWNAYESIQADLFDHLFAIVPELGLRAFQSPAGSDLVALARSSGDPP